MQRCSSIQAREEELEAQLKECNATKARLEKEHKAMVDSDNASCIKAFTDPVKRVFSKINAYRDKSSSGPDCSGSTSDSDDNVRRLTAQKKNDMRSRLAAGDPHSQSEEQQLIRQMERLNVGTSPPRVIFGSSRRHDDS